MPTGYTATLYEGKDQTFPEFALGCARAFGALILMRDDPQDAEIPDEFAPDLSYADAQIARHEARLAELDAATPEQVAEWVDADYREKVKLDRDRAEKDAAVVARYGAMLAEVEAWEPPTSEHVGLKEFMVKQLRESIDFDGPSPYRMAPEAKPDPATWLANERAEAARMLAISTDRRADEIKRAAGRTAWVQALRGSLTPAAVES